MAASLAMIITETGAGDWLINVVNPALNRGRSIHEESFQRANYLPPGLRAPS